MADFKRLADAEITEVVNVEDSVLIEQGGEIKRAPKSKVGGGSVEYDLVLNGLAMDNRLYIMSGSCEAVLNKLKNNEEPKVFIYGNNDQDYFYVPTQVFRAPTDGSYEHISFPDISVPGATTVLFGMSTDSDTGSLNAFMRNSFFESYVWAEEYSA